MALSLEDFSFPEVLRWHFQQHLQRAVDWQLGTVVENPLVDFVPLQAGAALGLPADRLGDRAVQVDENVKEVLDLFLSLPNSAVVLGVDKGRLLFLHGLRFLRLAEAVV